jgi:hypothetical protein
MAYSSVANTSPRSQAIAFSSSNTYLARLVLFNKASKRSSLSYGLLHRVIEKINKKHTTAGIRWCCLSIFNNREHKFQQIYKKFYPDYRTANPTVCLHNFEYPDLGQNRVGFKK